jgi:subtilase family serine protease
LNLSNSRFRILPIFGSIFILAFLVNPSAAASISIPKSTNTVLHISQVGPVMYPLDSTYNPSLGGAPFCSSGSLGVIICYPPSFLQKAYNFPSTTGYHSLDGTGQTIFLLDAFGYPTSLLQGDLNTYDTTFGLPTVTVTVLCGPTWTGSATDHCPVVTLTDELTAPNADPSICDAPGWAGETMLDLTMAHSLAPGAKIVLVVANDCYDTNLYGAESAVISQSRYRGGIMSQSFGEPDDLVTCTGLDPNTGMCSSWDPTLLDNCAATGCPDQVFQAAKAKGWTMIASSGDWGANTAAVYTGSTELTPSFPSTSPLVLAAGGTQGSPYGGQYGTEPGPGGVFSCAARATCNTGLVVINGGKSGCTTIARPGEPTSCYPVGYGGEATWQEVLNSPLTGGNVGYTSGGGISMLYGIPYYQNSIGHKYTTMLGAKVTATGRMVPDVSFNSAVYGGVMTYETTPDYPTGHWFLNGGTSAASPAWAAIVALIGQAIGRHPGFINSEIYGFVGQNSQGTGPFHDIKQGNNAICSGECGEDGFVAGKGYDLTTGFGTPNVSQLISAFVQDHQ